MQIQGIPFGLRRQVEAPNVRQPSNLPESHLMKPLCTLLLAWPMGAASGNSIQDSSSAAAAKECRSVASSMRRGYLNMVRYYYGSCRDVR